MPATLHEHALFTAGPVLGGVHRLDAGVASHAHDFLEIAVIGAGHGRHVTSQGEQPLRRGQVVVLRPGAWHGFRDCAGLVVANCCLSAQALRAELAPLYDLAMPRRMLWTDPVASGTHGVAVTAVDPAAAEEAVAEIGLLERDLAADRSRPGRVLGRLVTVLGILADGRTPAGQEHGPAIHPAVAATVARLEAAPARAWRLDDLARAVSLDPAYLGRLFRRHVGLTPLDFLARLRAERAATLLAHSALPAARVGAAVGWDDPTYFARRFRALVGLTPTEYRRRSRAAVHEQPGPEAG
ncbi:AraC family transcriptional regulator [Nonomuraea gerenzanensis]|uniref:Transcriptional regulator containing an amidase domain and an AraC-type DNA-binding HTH domain n=1 Tax=Nonomuraea gerenzanensis TaxID=93944 RepID=A0A1M4ECM2_9ACTN|nr:helix-turn-helix domain-containing protein [Nonomuraea gerenzanensis]UBU08394.1 AraC family transcriptional regulator [Nonomuraea gerenzanensis]SBO96737.1 Transcriptional regulator containing an amidase domain and an AraC-type DNA-binding HTH domain [Nonomuraea gerenzanensis]